MSAQYRFSVGQSNLRSQAQRAGVLAQPQNATLERVIGRLLSDGTPRSEEEILKAIMAKYRVVLRALVPDVLKQSRRFEFKDANWRLRPKPAPQRESVMNTAAKKQRRRKKKTDRRSKQAARPNASSGNSRRRTPSDSPSVSVHTVSGGLPSLGKRR